ncbi:N-6 DNA methylase [Aliikangiella maris]|uniref:N-6 DNA methylase n=2 Tax=Aliikangiella maris TaxID=3162458 RepID=A0ABV2BQD3_9GAMM
MPFSKLDQFINDIWEVNQTLSETIRLENGYPYFISLVFIKLMNETATHKILANKHLLIKQILEQPEHLILDKLNQCLAELDNLNFLLPTQASNQKSKDRAMSNQLLSNIDFRQALPLDLAKANKLFRAMLQSLHQIPSPNKNSSPQMLCEVFLTIIDRVNSTIPDVAIFYTPTAISGLVQQLIQPTGKESIYDPACGTSSLMIKVAEFSQYKREKMDLPHFFGEEAKQQIGAIAKMNFILHGINHFEINIGNSLSAPAYKESKNQLRQFDVVVSAPPFKIDHWRETEHFQDNLNRFNLGLPPANKADFAFLLHGLASLKKHQGRMAIISPQGILFRGEQEKLIRTQLIENNFIDCIINLPPKSFYQRNINAAILILRKDKRNKEILFINAENYFTPSKRLNTFDDKQILKISKIYHDFCNSQINKQLQYHKKTVQFQAKTTEISGQYLYQIQSSLSGDQQASMPDYCIATHTVIKQNDYNLNPPLYFGTKKLSNKNIRELMKSRKQLKASLNKIDLDIQQLLSKLGQND